MKGIAIALSTLLLTSGCTGETLHPQLMGTTAKCLNNAKQKNEAGSKAYQSAVNECMWAKSLDVKD